MEEWEDVENDDDSQGKMEDTDLDHSGLEDDEDILPTHTSQKMKRSMSFLMLKDSEVANESAKLVEETMQLCNLSSHATACILLQYFKWNKEKLIENYLDNPEKVLEKAGISSFDVGPQKKTVPDHAIECLICMDTLPATELFSLSCLHYYCKSCWKEYLEVKILDGPSCINSRCPSPKCKAIVDETAFKMLVSPSSFLKYERYLCRAYVENNDYVKWCPSPGCSFAVRSDSSQPKKAVTCSCGFQFCFMCADSDIGSHLPTTCEQVQKWKMKSKDESENVKWMLQNTKKCPKCRSPIEKNGGCMHMTCRNANCMFEFCWLCRGPWTEHGQATGGYYQCNKFDPSKEKKDYAEKPSDGKTELETYMFYFHRYESHKNALKIASEQRNQAHLRAQTFMDILGVRSTDTKFLSEATDQLISSRRVLQYSYVMGFYLDRTKEAEKNLFEYLQEDLEKHTNDLSTCYERGCARIHTISYNDFMKWKEEMTNKIRISTKFFDNFLKGVAEGLLVCQ